MAIPYNVPTPSMLESNNPSKEIIGGSGIYDSAPLGPAKFFLNGGLAYYSVDRINSPIANTGIYVGTSSTTPNPADPNSYKPYDIRNGHSFFVDVTGRVPPLNKAMLNDGNLFIDDMLIFNPYIHYDDTKLVVIDPESFLVESIVTFNRYSRSYR